MRLGQAARKWDATLSIGFCVADTGDQFEVLATEHVEFARQHVRQLVGSDHERSSPEPADLAYDPFPPGDGHQYAAGDHPSSAEVTRRLGTIRSSAIVLTSPADVPRRADAQIPRRCSPAAKAARNMTRNTAATANNESRWPARRRPQQGQRHKNREQNDGDAAAGCHEACAVTSVPQTRELQFRELQLGERKTKENLVVCLDCRHVSGSSPPCSRGGPERPPSRFAH